MLLANALCADEEHAKQLTPLIRRSDAQGTMGNDERRQLKEFVSRLGDMCLEQLAQQAADDAGTSGVEAQIATLGFTRGQISRLLRMMGVTSETKAEPSRRVNPNAAVTPPPASEHSDAAARDASATPPPAVPPDDATPAESEGDVVPEPKE